MKLSPAKVLIIFITLIVGTFLSGIAVYKLGLFSNEPKVTKKQEPEECFVQVKFSPNVKLREVPCGLFSTADDGSIEIYVGRLEKVRVEKGKVYLVADLGSEILEFYAGLENTGIIFLTENYDNYLFPDSRSVKESKLILNKNGINDLKIYIGKYARFSLRKGSLTVDNLAILI